ncbi:restriction endonuclease subunit S [Pseudescherichia sp.]|uniref:restriction endonuclease subunit S n=1 Tax=Pseudescherichia sp. TaxID=2055881 RepID=UPI00289C5D1D|nr:restriction endonuclease subunit S [Pseudescherichia sp.]
MKKIFIEKSFQSSPIGEIPTDWKHIPLSDIAEINPKPIKLSNDFTKISFIGMADVTVDSHLSNTTDKSYGEVKKGFTSFYNNDILVAKITPCFENGKGALVKGLKNGIGFGSTEFHVLRAKPMKGCASFIHYITTTEDFRKKGEMNMTGTAGQKRVGKDFIANYVIACPPVDEQTEIANFLSIVDKKIELIDRKIIETQNLKKALLQKLFSEGVGVQDENGKWHPHTELKKSSCGKNPKSWHIAKLGEHATKVGSGVTPKGGSKAYVNHGIPLLRSQNILFGKLKLDDVAFITETQHEKMKGSQLQPRDVLLNITGASIGRCAVLPDDFLEGNVNQHVCIIRTTSSLLPEFVSIFLNSHFGQKQIWNLQAGGNREGLNFQQIRSFDIPLPPVNEQKEIMGICSTVDSKIRLLEQQKSETQILKKGLMQKLLTGEWRIPLDCDEAEAA